MQLRAGHFRHSTTELTAKQKKQQRAQELFYDGLDAPDPADRLPLIEKARKLDPKIVDILFFTAVDSLDIQTMIENRRRAVKVGEERPGNEMQEMHGHFWSLTHVAMEWLREIAKSELINQFNR